MHVMLQFIYWYIEGRSPLLSWVCGWFAMHASYALLAPLNMVFCGRDFVHWLNLIVRHTILCVVM